jgi:hypothetical protein
MVLSEHRYSRHLSPLAGRGIGRFMRPSLERTPKQSFGYVALAIRVRGYRSINWHQLRGEKPLTPTLSPQVRGEGVYGASATNRE